MHQGLRYSRPRVPLSRLSHYFSPWNYCYGPSIFRAWVLRSQSVPLHPPNVVELPFRLGKQRALDNGWHRGTVAVCICNDLSVRLSMPLMICPNSKLSRHRSPCSSVYSCFLLPRSSYLRRRLGTVPKPCQACRGQINDGGMMGL